MSSQSDMKAQDRTAPAADNASASAQPLTAETEEFAGLIQALASAFEPVEPSLKFADDLRADLLGERQSLTQRLRQMPARLPIAAVLALIAGCLLFMMRRLFGSATPQDIQEEAVATPL